MDVDDIGLAVARDVISKEKKKRGGAGGRAHTVLNCECPGGGNSQWRRSRPTRLRTC